jgi:predicted amidohydrolase
MTDETKVAAVTMNCVMGEPETNLDRIESWAEKTRAEGATFAVFPEECITGSLNKSKMNFETARKVVAKAERMTAPRLKTLCRRLRMTLAVGTIESAGDRFGNNVVVFGPTGRLGTFTKVHLPNEGERKWFVPGDHVLIVKSQGWTFSVGICADLNYPELFRAAARAGAEFFLLAVGCNGDGTQQCAIENAMEYSRLMYPCAVANGLYIFYADQSGCDRMSVAFSQNLKGQVVDLCAAREGFIVTAVSREAIRKARAGGDPTNLHFIRPEVYANIQTVKS